LPKLPQIKAMLFSREFFDLNLRFARRISDVTGQGLQPTLLSYTHLYLAFGLGRDFDPEHSTWQSYLRGLSDAPDPAEYTHHFYLAQETNRPKPEPENAFGCFSYAMWEGHRVRLHFHNATNERGVLKKPQAPKRLAELREMVEHLKTTAPATSTVVGGSWLYNIETYRRLFPESYLRSAQLGSGEFQFLALWGQFLLSDGHVRPHIAQVFLQGIERQKTLDGVTFCFPYQVLRLESPIKDFYIHFGVG
jgi:hypothetical protein